MTNVSLKMTSEGLGTADVVNLFVAAISLYFFSLVINFSGSLSNFSLQVFAQK